MGESWDEGMKNFVAGDSDTPLLAANGVDDKHDDKTTVFPVYKRRFWILSLFLLTLTSTQQSVVYIRSVMITYSTAR